MVENTDGSPLRTTLVGVVLGAALGLGACTGEEPEEEQAIVYADAVDTLEPMSEARFAHTATTLVDGRVLVIGGILGPPSMFDVDAYVAEVDLWDPTSESFERGASLAAPRTGHSATLLRGGLADGRVVVLGGRGYNDQGLVTSVLAVEVWDPATEAFSTVAELDTGVLFHCAVAEGPSTVLVIDDCYPEGCAPQRVDVDAGTVSVLGGTPSHRYGLDADCAMLSDGRVLLAGGEDTSPSGNLPVDELEIYDPASESFEVVGPMSNAYGEGTELITLGTDEFLLVGGAAGPPFGQLFDASSGEFRAVDGEVVNRRAHTLELLADGRVLILGGLLMDSPSIEYAPGIDVYDMVGSGSGSFVSLSADIPVRSGHASAPLADGRVLIVGGEGADGPRADAYLFR